MAPLLHRLGAKVIWRSHIGTDKSNSVSDGAWRFLEPYLRDCAAFVFTRQAYVPDWMPLDRVAIIPPSIDPLSPKNEPIADEELPFFLAQIGLTSGPTGRRATFTRADGTTDAVTRHATIVCEGGPLDNLSGLVVQVSRWDRLKDMVGVLKGFASGVCGRVDAELALVGPEVESVSDDPEGAEVLEECIANWRALPPASRRRIRLVTLPMADVQENAVMVNAIQRSAAVVVQKSLEEGFGLTVAEGMWKGKPVIASAVGGIVEQVAPGTGILLRDPTDLDAFGDAVAGLLEHPNEMAALGTNAYRHVLDQFVGDLHLLRYAELIDHLIKQ
jgi:trehalose synthase